MFQVRLPLCLDFGLSLFSHVHIELNYGWSC
jgi:hypothetical protein